MEGSQPESKNSIIVIISIITAIFGSIATFHEAYPDKTPNFPEYPEKSFTQCSIKWNISFPKKEKIYHLPGCKYYQETKINIGSWEGYFCTEQDAIKAGFRISEHCK